MSLIVPSTSRHGILSTTDMINYLTQGPLCLIGYTTSPWRTMLERKVIAMAWGLEIRFLCQEYATLFRKNRALNGSRDNSFLSTLSLKAESEHVLSSNTVVVILVFQKTVPSIRRLKHVKKSHRSARQARGIRRLCSDLRNVCRIDR